MKNEINDIKQEVEKIQEESFAMTLLKGYKKTVTRIFTMWVITFIISMFLLGYVIYLLNDTGSTNSNTTTEQIIEDVKNINDSSIFSGGK